MEKCVKSNGAMAALMLSHNSDGTRRTGASQLPMTSSTASSSKLSISSISMSATPSTDTVKYDTTLNNQKEESLVSTW